MRISAAAAAGHAAGQAMRARRRMGRIDCANLSGERAATNYAAVESSTWVNFDFSAANFRTATSRTTTTAAAGNLKSHVHEIRASRTHTHTLAPKHVRNGGVLVSPVKL